MSPAEKTELLLFLVRLTCIYTIILSSFGIHASDSPYMYRTPYRNIYTCNDTCILYDCSQCLCDPVGMDDTVERVILPLLQAGQYMLNYESTHCVALPLEYFRIPSAGNL